MSRRVCKGWSQFRHAYERKMFRRILLVPSDMDTHRFVRIGSEVQTVQLPGITSAFIPSMMPAYDFEAAETLAKTQKRPIHYTWKAPHVFRCVRPRPWMCVGELEEIKRNQPVRIYLGREGGSKFHEEVQMATVDPARFSEAYGDELERAQPTTRVFMKYLEEHNIIPLASEVMVYSREYGVMTPVDLMVAVPIGGNHYRLQLWELKTGNLAKFIQTTGAPVIGPFAEHFEKASLRVSALIQILIPELILRFKLGVEDVTSRVVFVNPKGVREFKQPCTLGDKAALARLSVRLTSEIDGLMGRKTERDPGGGIVSGGVGGGFKRKRAIDIEIAKKKVVRKN